MDKLKAMQSFICIVDKGSLTAAGVELGLSLPSMVRMLAALERELGTTLLNRTTRRIHLTDEGRQYLAHCRAIIDHVRQAEEAMHCGHGAPRGRLKVTASVVFGQRHIAPIVTELVRQYPEVSVELLCSDRTMNLVEEGLDAAVRIGHLSDSTLVALPLGTVRRVVCASPEYLERHGVPSVPEDIRHHPCVRFTGLSPREEWEFHSNSRRIAVPIRSVLTFNFAEAAIESCVTGTGLGLFLSYMVAPYKRAGKLCYVLENFEPKPLPVQLLYPQTKILSPTVRAFASLCVHRLQGAALD